MTRRTSTVSGMIALAALMRLVPHPWNFTPLTAMALFAGARLESKRVAFAVPLIALLVSDLVLGFDRSLPVVYGSFALIVAIGFWLRGRRGATSIAVATLASSVLFFVLTNLGVWLFEGLYPHTATGLSLCFTLAVPFFRNAVAGDLLYAGVLFGAFFLAERRFPVLRPQSALS